MALEAKIREKEDIISRAQAHAFGLLAQGVSTTLPDDKIEHQLQSFFAGDFLGWCMDYRRAKPEDSAYILELLEERSILADPRKMLLPQTIFWKSGVLVKAALAMDLCDRFLRHPFSLAPILGGLPLEDLLKKNGEFRLSLIFCHRYSVRRQILTVYLLLFSVDIRPDHFATWRVHTCEFIEAAFLPASPSFEHHARDFADSFSSLIRPLDENALAELAGIYETFGKMALQMWKRKTHIHVEGLEHPDLRDFRVGGMGMEADSIVGLEDGNTELDGRPIGVMVRPRIVSQPVLEGGRLGGRVVWCNAVVWVSSEGEF